MPEYRYNVNVRLDSNIDLLALIEQGWLEPDPNLHIDGCVFWKGELTEEERRSLGGLLLDMSKEGKILAVYAEIQDHLKTSVVLYVDGKAKYRNVFDMFYSSHR